MAAQNREGPVLVLGCTGMLGNALMRYLARSEGIEAGARRGNCQGSSGSQPFGIGSSSASMSRTRIHWYVRSRSRGRAPSSTVSAW